MVERLLVARGSDVGQVAGEEFVQTVLRGAGGGDVLVHCPYAAGAGEVGGEVAGGGVGGAPRAAGALGRVLTERGEGGVLVVGGGAGQVEGGGGRVEVGVGGAFSSGWWEVAECSS